MSSWRSILGMALGASLACGGSTIADDGGADGSTDTNTASDVGGPMDAGLSPACPSSAPTSGQSCTTFVSCEYGTSNDALCNVLYGCNGQQWSVLYGSEACDYDGSNGPSCPTTYTAAMGTCTATASACEYPEGRCECVVSCGGPPPPEDAGAQWICSSTQQGCPSPRGNAKIGATCTSPGQQCSYGACCSGASQTCSDAGIWTGNILAGGCP
jgi:hypothetical protein